MSNPRLMAEDVANHYMVKIDSRFPHSKNIRKNLRLPLLAITRRILLPRIHYAELQHSEVGTFGGVNHIDPTYAKSKDGLDWRDYVSSKSLLNESNHNQKSETEVSDLSDDNQTLHQYYVKRQPHGETRLTRRSLARMEAFLATCALALPDERILPLRTNKSKNINYRNADNDTNTASYKGKGLITGLQSFATSITGGTQKQKKIFHTSTGTHARTNTGNYHYPQIHIDDLTVRLELYIRSLRRIYALREQQLQKQREIDYRKCDKGQVECVLKFEPPRVTHKRIQIILSSLIATTNSVGSMRPILTKLLTFVTRELLAVEHLSEELDGYIRKIILEYEHLTSFASLAFLSSPGDSAESHLSPLLFNYFRYLTNECEMCIEKCKLESLLARAIHPGMRSVFKNAEFLSIGHLLEVCQEYRGQLENIVVSQNESDYFGMGFAMDVDETMTSFSPDVIASVVNGDVSEVKKCNSSATKAIKQALKDLRREIIMVNGYMLPPAQSLTELVQLLRERLHSRTVKLRDRKVANSKKSPDFQKNSSVECPSMNGEVESDSDTSFSNENDIISSGNEGDTDGSSSSSSIKKGKKEYENSTYLRDTKYKQKANGGNKTKNESLESSRFTHSKRRHFNVNAIDIMIRRLLIAASRTGSGGDAFFVVRDLFGGEGAEIVPSTVSPMGPYIDGKVSPTIELNVRLTCIIIRCHSTFNVYPKPYTGECEALIQLHTTTTETIQLQEVRVDDNGNEILSTYNTPHQENQRSKPTKLMLKEKKTESSGRRVLSIKPARYERVENWHTPS